MRNNANLSLAIVVLAGVVLNPAALAAQQTPTQLTLDEALRLARQHNPSYRRAIAQADAAGADVLAGIGGFLPNLNGNLNFNGSSQTRFTGQDDYGRPVGSDVSQTYRSSSSSQSLSSNISVFDGLQNFNSLKSARAGAAAADAGVAAEAAALDAEIKRRFYQVLRAQRLIEIEELLLEVRQRDLDATERLFRVAARSQVDVLGAQVEVSRQEQALETARGSARTSQLQLAEWIGLVDGVEFDVVGSLPEVFDPSGLDADVLAAHVLQHNPRLERARENAAQAAFSTSAARGRRWPSLSASASFSRSVWQDGYGGLFQIDPRDRGLSFGLTVSVPVFSRFQTTQAIARATATERSAEEDLRAAQLQLEREVRSYVIDVQNSYRQVQLAERSAQLARQRLSMAREQYQLGSIDFTQLQQVVTQSADAERQALTAQGNWANALVALEEIVGQPVRP